MRLTATDLAAFGEDGGLIHVIDTAFTGLAPDIVPDRIGVAVSGGGDSMALLHAATRWAGATGATVAAVTVNHGLRPEAGDEAAHVAQVCKGLGVTHSTLHWDGSQASGNIAAAARTARYGLIAQWAGAAGIDGVLLGHTQDDVAETFLMRLARASGVDGLALMDIRFRRHGLAWARPFWQQSRADLRTYLRRHGIDWVEDPTNDDMTRDRPRARAALAALAPLGITPEVLSEVALAQLSASVALDWYRDEEFRRCGRIEHGDVILTDRPRPPIPPEIERRLRIMAIRAVSGRDYPPRESGLVELDLALRDRGRHTLGGCLVTLRDGAIRFTREFKAVAGLSGPTDAMWDGRWSLKGPHAPDLHVAALGEAVKDTDWRRTGLPRDSLRSSPAIWRGTTLVAAPLVDMALGDNPPWTARIVTDSGSNRLSH